MAVRSIRSQWLRATLTMAIISIGIMALIGILTAIQAIETSIFDEFTSMGSNTFVIQKNTQRGRRQNKEIKSPNITLREAQRFKKQFDKPQCLVSLSVMLSSNATLKYEREKSKPNIQVIGADAAYLQCSGYALSEGRNITTEEVRRNARVAIIGKELAQILFSPSISPIGKKVNLNGALYTIIGVLKEKGSAMGFGGDRQIIGPHTALRTSFSGETPSYAINVFVNKTALLSGFIAEARSVFRFIRGIPIKSNAEDFEIRRSDSLASILVDNLRSISIAAVVIGGITLLGAVIGLLNIMLVSVTERTKEIGLRMAVGAKPEVIQEQFLIEAILICQFGGVAGIILGVAVGNIVSIILGINFFIPWLWTLLGFALCFIVGLTGGYYPALKASRQNPVDALRYE